jgi:hypothetical protein
MTPSWWPLTFEVNQFGDHVARLPFASVYKRQRGEGFIVVPFPLGATTVVANEMELLAVLIVMEGRHADVRAEAA